MTFRLFWTIAGNEARKLMSYRVDFWVNAILVFFVEFGIAYYVWSSVFAETGRATIGGFSKDAMVTYYVLAVLLGKIVLGHARDFTISRDIYEGGLTRYILYPTRYFWFKYAEHLGALLPALIRMALFGCVAVFALSSTPELHVSLASILMGAVTIAVATLLHFLIIFALEGVAFWADNTWALIISFNFVCSLLGGLLLPLDLFPSGLKLLVEALPFRHLVYVPVITMLGHVSVGEWARNLAISLVWCGVIAVIDKVVWKQGELRYNGVGI